MAAGYFEYSPMLFEAPGLGWPGPGDAQARRSGLVRFPPRRRSGNGLLWTFHGTSQASPTAAGIAALLLQVDGTQTPARIAATLKASGAKVTDPNNSWQFTEIDALNAVDLARQVTAWVTVNQSTFSVGQTLNVPLGLANPGRPEAADVYLGLFRPDSSIQFITNTAIVLGNVTDLSSFRPVVVGVPLATPFAVTVPNFFSYTWLGSEPRGGYVFFLLVRGGAKAAREA
jgi:hypothetical protein